MTTIVHEALAPRSRSGVVADLTDRRPDNGELELLATGRALEYVHKGRRLLLPVTRGGSTGAGAVYARNLPAPNTYVIDAVQFAVLTSRNRKTYPAVAWPGHAAKVNQRIDKVGVVSKIWVFADLTITGVVGAPTVRNTYPWNLIQRLKISANGIANLYYCDGLDLRALMHTRRPFFFDREASFALPGGVGDPKTARLVWEIPISFDESLIGSIFAQTEDNELTVEIETPASGDVWSANPPTVAGTFTVACEYFSLPYMDSKEGRKIVIPDIRQLHGFIAKEDNVGGTGEHTVNLMRSGGILTRTFQRLDNAYSTQGPGVDDPATVITSHKFRYGGNVVPTDFVGRLQKWLNQADAGDRPIPAAELLSGNVNYLVDDYVKANSVRDVIHLLGVTEPQILNQIAAGTVINAGASMHTAQEHMVAG